MPCINKQSAEKTKEKLNKINSDNLKITNVESRSSGIIVIESENCEDREKIKRANQEKTSKQYEVVIPNSTEFEVYRKIMEEKKM